MKQKNGIICFFLMDDILFAFKKNQKNKIKKLVDSLSKSLIIEIIRELK